MRVLLGRAGAGILVLFACYCVVQAATAFGVAPVLAQSRGQSSAPHLNDPLRVVQPDRSEWEVFQSPHAVIPTGRATINLPILMYHYIQNTSPVADALTSDLSVSPVHFQQQMDWLAGNGYHAVDFNDVRAYFAGVKPLPARPVVITLDDGYADLFTTAYPILRAHHFKAVAYIVSGFVGIPAYVTAAQVRQMDADGIQIAAHTITHVDLRHGSDAQIWHQIADSKTALEKLVQHPVLDFAYPSGKFDGRSVGFVRQAGFDTAVTTNSGTLHGWLDRYTWTRARVRGAEDLADFVIGLGIPDTTVLVNADPALYSPASGPPLGNSLPLLLPIEGDPTPRQDH